MKSPMHTGPGLTDHASHECPGQHRRPGRRRRPGGLDCRGGAEPAWHRVPRRRASAPGVASSPRAKTTSIQTVEHLRRWRVARELRAAAPLKVAWSQRVTFCESLSGRRITDFDNAFGLTTRRDSRFAEPGQQVPQPVVEEVLRQHLSTRPPSGPAARTRRDRAGAGRARRHHPRRRRQRVSGTGSLRLWLRWRGRRCPGPDRRAVCGPVIVMRPDHVVAWCGEAVLWPQTPCSIRSQAGLRPRAQAPTATARQR